jgi:hypothetical protein
LNFELETGLSNASLSRSFARGRMRRAERMAARDGRSRESAGHSPETFSAATADQLAAAANALVGLKGEWCEVTSFHSVEGRRFKLYERVGD